MRKKRVSKPVTIKSWENCGLVPWNPDLIKQNMNNTNPTAIPSEREVGDVAQSLTRNMLNIFFGPGEESTVDVNPKRKNRGQQL